MKAYACIAAAGLAVMAAARAAEESAPVKEAAVVKGELATATGTVHCKWENGLVVAIKLTTRELGVVSVVLDDQGRLLVGKDLVQVTGLLKDGWIKVQTIDKHWGVSPAPERAFPE